MQYRLAIFDLDGTILDTLGDLAASNAYALEKHGFPRRTTEEVRAFVGNGVGRLIERSLPREATDEQRTAVLADFKAHYGANCMVRTAPYTGIPTLLRKLRAHGIRTAVVSNKSDFAVQKLCDRFFDGLFDAVVGEREGILRKPAPDSVNAVLKQLDTARGDAVYIGDSEVDVLTAKNAKLDCMTVTWGFRTRDALEAAGAKVIFDTMNELEAALLG